MRLVSHTIQIDDNTYDPIHHITLEFSGDAIEQMVTKREWNEVFSRVIGDGESSGVDWKKNYEQLMGMRLMEILEEEFKK